MNTLRSADYKGKPVNSRQGQPFREWTHQGFTSIDVLPFLNGRPWDDFALGYVHALRPSHVRVVQGGVQLDSETWRVTVWLADDGLSIDRISQEVRIGISDGFLCGHDMDVNLKKAGDA